MIPYPDIIVIVLRLFKLGYKNILKKDRLGTEALSNNPLM